MEIKLTGLWIFEDEGSSFLVFLIEDFIQFQLPFS